MSTTRTALLLLSAVLPACDLSPPEVGTATQELQVAGSSRVNATEGDDLYTPNATIGNVIVNVDPTIHVAVQQNLFRDPLHCGAADAIVFNGSRFFEAGNCTTDFSAFARLNPHAVEEELTDFIDDHPDLDRADLNRPDRIVVMDIERPGAIEIRRELNCKNGPLDYIDHTPQQRTGIIKGLKRRIVGTRLAFPNAKLALYPTLAPHAQGSWNEGGTFDLQVDGLVQAQAAGLFDDIPWEPTWGPVPECLTGNCPCPFGICRGLDYFLPVLYTRFGCDGSGGPCDQHWGSSTVAAYTNQAVEAASLIDSGLPLLPFFSFWVSNCQTCTAFDDRLIRDLGVGAEAALDATLRVSMQILNDASVDDVVLWTGGKATNPLMNQVPPAPPTWTVDDYTCRL
jgi:hypothetical protein